MALPTHHPRLSRLGLEGDGQVLPSGLLPWPLGPQDDGQGCGRGLGPGEGGAWCQQASQHTNCPSQHPLAFSPSGTPRPGPEGAEVQWAGPVGQMLTPAGRAANVY